MVKCFLIDRTALVLTFYTNQKPQIHRVELLGHMMSSVTYNISIIPYISVISVISVISIIRSYYSKNYRTWRSIRFHCMYLSLVFRLQILLILQKYLLLILQIHITDYSKNYRSRRSIRFHCICHRWNLDVSPSKPLFRSWPGKEKKKSFFKQQSS